MTSRKSLEVERRRQRKPQVRQSLAGDLRAALLAELELSTRVRFPTPMFRDDPVEFTRRILGVSMWSRQVEILEAVRDHKRVAISSGRKIGKSNVAAAIALWYYCSWEDARVVMTSTTSRQVDQILWRELRMARARAGRCIDCKQADPSGYRIPRPCPHSAIIEGDIGELARTGLKSADFREIVGFTARESEAVAGISGANLLYIGDEASGIHDSIFEAIEGNLAGGGRIVLFSNPTKNTGEFFEAFHGKSNFYYTLKISSEETPNYVEGREVIPGLAGREWIEQQRLAAGEDSPFYKVHVLGDFAKHEAGRIFSLAIIKEAELRWPDADPAGRLFVGVDPAGPSGSGDETVFAPRRGQKLLGLYAHRGLTADAHLTHLTHLLAKFKIPRELPVVVIDREGSVGAELHGLLRNYVESNRAAFELVAVRASDRAVRQPQVYDRVRDELAANLEVWFREGGAIPEDVKLATELHSLEWKPVATGRLKVTPKDIIRKAIGRSPDRYDALALSAWEPLSLADGVPQSVREQIAAAPESQYVAEATFDPYAAGDAWRER